MEKQRGAIGEREGERDERSCGGAAASARRKQSNTKSGATAGEQLEPEQGRRSGWSGRGSERGGRVGGVEKRSCLAVGFKSWKQKL